MNHSFAALTLSLILSAPMTFAQNAQSAVEGLGLRSCAEVTAARTDNPEAYQSFGTWLSGFLTAANAFEDNTFDLTPWQTIEVSTAQVARYCQSKPDHRMAQAVAAYLAYLRPNRLQERSEMISLRNGEQAVFIYQEMLERVRDKLRETGDLDADQGDAFDAAFGKALLAYQGKNSIPGTGLPDTPTLLKMFP
jgi:hypothetical protein